MIGTPMRALGGIPVERAQDIAKAGKGKVISLKNGVLIVRDILALSKIILLIILF